MRTCIIITFFLLGTQICLSQRKTPYNTLVKHLNQCIDVYVNTNPHLQEYYKFDSLDLDKSILNPIQEDHTKDENGIHKDSIHAIDLLYYLEKDIKAIINEMVNHQYFDLKRFKDVRTNGGDFSIVESDDKKLYNFSLAEKLGGTYRSRSSWMHYTEIDSLQQIYNVSDPYDKLDGDGFNSIHTLKTEEGTKYVLTGSVRGCSYCFETFVILVKLENGEFKHDFSHQVNSRDWSGGVEYHPDTKTITVDYITDDLTTHCNCEESEYGDAYDAEDNPPVKKKCHCTFVFNGSNFELIKMQWEKTE